MKYRTKVVINKPREIVLQEIRSKEAAFHWMDGLQAFDLMEGNMNEVGSKYKMVFQNKGKRREMIETITEMNPPTTITTVYEMGSVWNQCINIFEEEKDTTTYIMETEFRFGFPFVLFTWALKPVFVKETLSGMTAFKKYVEQL